MRAKVAVTTLKMKAKFDSPLCLPVYYYFVDVDFPFDSTLFYLFFIFFLLSFFHPLELLCVMFLIFFDHLFHSTMLLLMSSKFNKIKSNI